MVSVCLCIGNKLTTRPWTLVLALMLGVSVMLVSGQREPKPNNGLSLFGVRRLPNDVDEIEVLHDIVPVHDEVKLNVVICPPSTRAKPRSAVVSTVL